MAVSVTVAGVTYSVPTTGEELWGVETTDYLVALGEELANVVTSGDIPPETLVTIANNQVAAANVTDFVLDGSIIQSATAEYYIQRQTTGPNVEVGESGTLYFLYNDTAGTWSFAQVGNNVAQAGVTFSMLGNQLQYVSSNLAGTHTGKMRYRVRALPK